MVATIPDDAAFVTRYCPRCARRVDRLVTSGPGDYRVGPCGCLVAATRLEHLPSERPETNAPRDRVVAGGRQDTGDAR